MTEINVDDGNAAEQTASAAVVPPADIVVEGDQKIGELFKQLDAPKIDDIIGSVEAHKAAITSTRVLAEEYRTPIDDAATRFSTQAVLYRYDDDTKPPSAVKLVDDISTNPLNNGKVYTKDELVAYVATLNAIVARLM